MSNLIKPRTLRGFRDFLPEAMIPRERLIETAKQVYRSYGFVPIDTPALEYSEILCGKGSEETDRQMFRFDHGKHDVAMRFDLTVPLARFVAQNANELGLPFKRYHVAPVWRGERPQAGRYREFIQCDFDTIGTRSIASDIETGLVIYDLMRAIGFEKFSIRVNNRKVLNGLLEKFGLAEESVGVLRSLDKLPKIGREKVAEEMREVTSASEPQVKEILQLAEVRGSNAEVLAQLEPLAAGNELAEEGLSQLRAVIDAAASVGITDTNLQVDVSIARGLDYYTGTIYETFLDDLPSIGSVCSGGRYDNLAQLYTKQELPGIGASLGLDRLLAAMQTLEMLPATRTTADVMIVQFAKDHLQSYLGMAHQLRAGGIKTEVFPDAKKLNQQFKYADRRGFDAVLIAGDDELAANKVQVKWLADGSQTELSTEEDCTEIVAFLKARLAETASSGGKGWARKSFKVFGFPK
jgi:histidyl-tRNA synthetase